MSVLTGILEQRRSAVAERERRRPLATVERQVTGTTRSLAAALSRPGLRFILEIKRASPSAGLLRSEFNPGEIAEAYDGVADAISVLTEPDFFHGSIEHLGLVRSRTRRPVLCKDFVVAPYQVVEARAAGADAILLMMSVLDELGYLECAAAARQLGMDVLTEIHDEPELDRALALDARIIGINNRDLRTLAIDLATTERLAPRIPRDRLVVAESGIRSRVDVDRLSACARVFLVGSEIMRSPDVGQAARTLVYGSVKVCGLARAEDAQAAWRAGASFGGLVFAPESRRVVSEEQAAVIRHAAPLAWVGVFVNAESGRVTELANRLQLSAVQLHGDETPSYVSQLRGMLPATCEIWRAIPVRKRIPSRAETGADRLLLDNYHPTERGGSGQRFDWGLLRDVADRSRIVLAGGLTPDNARRAHEQGCGILDVSSGVESSPGIKDEHRLRAFFDALRSQA
ncbi:MAG: bifunctional indole-3-glycerol-phosphate synthase TrpC/phosphoribosylanthranilate isomerase TrpF [Gemmatimonadota bacterium]